MKLSFRIEFETEVILTPEQITEWELEGLSPEEAAKVLSENPDAAEYLAPRFDPDDYPTWSCVDHGWMSNEVEIDYYEDIDPPDLDAEIGESLDHFEAACRGESL